MDIKTFQAAKAIREKIDRISGNKLQIEKMRERKDDADFNLARQLAHDFISFSISRLEDDFRTL